MGEKKRNSLEAMQGNKADSGSSQADPRGGGNNAVDPRDRITVKDNEKFKSYYKVVFFYLVYLEFFLLTLAALAGK